jgi:hypothetical protein
MQNSGLSLIFLCFSFHFLVTAHTSLHSVNCIHMRSVQHAANSFQVSTNYNIYEAPYTRHSLERHLKNAFGFTFVQLYFYCLLCRYSSHLPLVSSPQFAFVSVRRMTARLLRFALRLRYRERFQEWQSSSFSFTLFQKRAVFRALLNSYPTMYLLCSVWFSQ